MLELHTIWLLCLQLSPENLSNEEIFMCGLELNMHRYKDTHLVKLEPKCLYDRSQNQLVNCVTNMVTFSLY